MYMRDIRKLHDIMCDQLSLVNDVLERYTDDEAGQNGKIVYLGMSDIDKLALLTYTLNHTSNWEDFESELVINFDFQVWR